jgi:4-hydroxy-3-methylbut-2-enyl diphosphate reductase IspH
MGATVKSSEFVDDNVLFATKQSANSWRLSLTVDSSNTIAEGVAKQAAHVTDITQIDGVSVTAGASATDHATIGAKDLSTDAGTREALIILAEKINRLTYQLEQAGLMASSS